MAKSNIKGGGQLDMFSATDPRYQELTNLIYAIMHDKDWQFASTAQIAAEMVRACVGMGKFRLAVPVPSIALNPPKKHKQRSLR